MINAYFEDAEMAHSVRPLRLLMAICAWRSKDDRITPDHLFTALCRYDAKSFRGVSTIFEEVADLSEEDKDWLILSAAAHRNATEALKQVFDTAFPDHVHSSRLRIADAVEKRTPKPQREPLGVDMGREIHLTYSRDSATKEIFVLADSLAGGMCEPLHLMIALLNSPLGGAWREALTEFEMSGYTAGALLAATSSSGERKVGA